MVQKVSGEMIDPNALLELETNYTPTNYLRVAVGGTLEERTPSQVRSDIGAGPGSVTSVAVADATGITWAGSPITSSGTLTPTLSINLQGWSGITTESKQDADADLTAIAAITGTGLATRTSGNTWTTRSIAGTTNRITLTNGDGVSGSPTVDIHASYVGQTSITTLGTISTGTWSATTIAANKGGTGLTSYTTGNYINAASSSTLQERTPTQVRSDLAITTSSSGTYTPTIASIANTTVNSSQGFQWLRVGNTVTVSGRVTITPTASATSTEVSLTLPVASATTVLEQIAGTGMDFTAVVPGLVFGDPTTDTARFRFKSIGTSSMDFVLHYTYQVL